MLSCPRCEMGALAGPRHPEGTRGEPAQPIGQINLCCYLAPHRIFASEMTSSSWSRSYRCVIRSAHKSAPHRSSAR